MARVFHPSNLRIRSQNAKSLISEIAPGLAAVCGLLRVVPRAEYSFSDSIENAFSFPKFGLNVTNRMWWKEVESLFVCPLPDCEAATSLSVEDLLGAFPNVVCLH